MSDSAARAGPLSQLRILEFAGIGAVPFCGMLCADLGADVVRIDRPGAPPIDRFALETRGRRSVVLDLKSQTGRRTALELIAAADALLEGFRPGVMERLGLGPETALERNPKLVYGRMTGWGQNGPYARMAGHDLNFIALSGALHAMGPAEKPAIPLNLIGDFGGGALYLAFGVLAGILHAQRTGEGQTIDCAMTEGTISLLTLLHGHLARGTWLDRRASNIIDGAAPFYNVYQCADGEWIAVAAIEPQFYDELLRLTGAHDPAFSAQLDHEAWPSLSQKLAAIFKTRSRAEWCSILEGSDACFAPVLSMRDAQLHPHNVARESFVEVDGVRQPAPVPRFSRTPGSVRWGPTASGTHQESVLREWGVDPELVDAATAAASSGATG
jgi:alpha-methylacyl-CoA racemase